MDVAALQARVKAKVWQGIAQSGVSLASIPQEQAEALVSAITGAVLQEMGQAMGEAATEWGGAPEAAPFPTAGEQLLWEGRPFLSISTHYQITSERIRIRSGVLGKQREDVELVSVQDVDQSQSIGERLLNLGDLHIRSHDPSSPEITLSNIEHPDDVHEILRQAVLAARKRYGLGYREEM